MALALSLGIGACGSDETDEPASSTAPSAALSPSDVASESPEPALVGSTAAAAFTAYAVGRRSDVPWADTVIYRIAGEHVARFPAGLADRRETWLGCPRGSDTYEGRECPVSPLSTAALLEETGGQTVYELEVPSMVGCNRYRLSGVEGARTIWIRPDMRHRDCFSDFAIAISLDRSGRITLVDLALSGP